MDQTDPLVAVTISDGIAMVQVDDPAHRNAISYELSKQLAAAVGAIRADERVGALILTATPPVFSAGGSIDDLESPPGPLAAVYAGFEALAACAFPTIAIVAGPAIGAGVNLALACDVILGFPAAVFDCRFLDIGIHPGGGHLWQLRHRVGRQGAAALVLLGDTLTGREAEARGLVWRCVEDDELLPLALRLARRAARRPAPVVQRHQGDPRPVGRGDDRSRCRRPRARPLRNGRCNSRSSSTVSAACATGSGERKSRRPIRGEGGGQRSPSAGSVARRMGWSRRLI